MGFGGSCIIVRYMIFARSPPCCRSVITATGENRWYGVQLSNVIPHYDCTRFTNVADKIFRQADETDAV